MIDIFEGRIGSGKTFGAVRRMAEHMSAGLTVATNITLKWDGFLNLCAERFGFVPDVSQYISLHGQPLAEFHRLTPSGAPGAPVLVVLDECHLEFNSRDWNSTSRELLAFLTQSRKQHTDIIFISQSAENIDKQFRRLVGSYWRFRDLRKWKVPGIGITAATAIHVCTFGLVEGERLLACQYDYDGTTLMQREFMKLDQLVFRSYDTNELHSNFPRAGAAARVEVRRPRSRRAFAILRLVMFLALISVIVGGWLFKKRGEDKKAVAQAAPAPAPVHSPPLPVAAAPVAPPAPVVPTVQSMRAGPSSVVPQPAPEAIRAAYDIYSETFRAWYGDNRTLRTEAGTYRVGSMSSKGLVLAASRDAAYIAQPDGRTGWVVAEDRGGPPPPPLPSPTPPPQGGETDIKPSQENLQNQEPEKSQEGETRIAESGKSKKSSK